jgi:hypothetical protein
MNSNLFLFTIRLYRECLSCKPHVAQKKNSALKQENINGDSLHYRYVDIWVESICVRVLHRHMYGHKLRAG